MSLMPLDFTERLRLTKPSLSATDKKIIAYIMEHKDSLRNARLKTITDKLQVSSATITRFAQKLGYSGFIELKRTFTNPALEDTEKSLADIYVRQQYQTVVHDYMNLLSAFVSTCDFNQIQQVAQQMRKANHLLLLGLGNSGFVAEELRAKLFYLGLHTTAAKDPHDIRIAARHTKPEDLIIVFSRTGTSTCIVDALALARENQTPTVLITTSLSPRVHQQADYCFVLPDRNLFMTHKILSNQLPQLFISDILYSELFKLDEAGYQQKQDETQRLNM